MKPTFLLLFLCAAPLFAFDPPPKLAEQLLSNDSEIRLKAVDTFNKMPSEAKYKMVPDFMVALSNEDPAVRNRAQKILSVLGVKTDGAAVPDAKQAMPQEKKELPPAPVVTAPDERAKALEEVQKDKTDTYGDLREQLEKEKEAAGFADPRELRGQSGSQSAAFPLLEALKDPDPVVKIRAARRLGDLRPPPLDAIPLLQTMLTDKDKEMRAAAAGALGGFGPEARAAVPTLTQALSDEDPGVRQIAADALKQISVHR